MREHERSQGKILLSFTTVIVTVLLDRILKIYFVKNLAFGESVPIVQDVFHFTLIHNTGIAFGLFKNQGIVFIIIPIIAILVIAYHIFTSHQDDNAGYLYIFAFSLILAGALGNLIDRIAYGYVIDFIDFRIWPVFNLADTAITIGAIFILIKCIPSFVK